MSFDSLVPRPPAGLCTILSVWEPDYTVDQWQSHFHLLTVTISLLPPSISPSLTPSLPHPLSLSLSLHSPLFPPSLKFSLLSLPSFIQIDSFCKLLSDFCMEYRTMHGKILTRLERKKYEKERKKTKGKLIVSAE